MRQSIANRGRALRMVGALNEIGFSRGGPELGVMGTLAHLRHLCDFYDLDFGQVDRKAYDLYLLERQENDAAAHSRHPGL